MAQEVTPSGSFYPAYSAPQEGRGGLDTTKQLLFVVFKWRRFILIVPLVFAVAAGIAAYLKPPVRAATAQILIKVDRVPLQISGLAARTDRGQLSQNMNSEAQLIKSRQVLRSVAMKLLSNPHKDEGVEEGELEAKITALAEDTAAVALPESNVLRLSYYAETSEEAVRTLGLIIDEYIEQQAAIQSGSDKLLKFYEQEKQRVEAELREAEDQLNKWQGKNETVSIKEQITSQLDILENRRKTLQETEAQLGATKAKVAILRNELKGQPERLLTVQEQVQNPLAAKLKEQLVTAEASLQDLLQRFTEKHRSVIEKKEQIEFLKKESAGAEQNIIGRETTGLNSLREGIKQHLSDAQALLSSLMSQKQILEKQVHEGSDSLAALREKKVKIDELSRLVELHKDAFMLYGKKLEEGRIATGLGKEQLANVALIGPPYARPGTDAQHAQTVVLSACVGLVLAMAIAFGLEFFNNVLRTRQDVEYYLGLPLLAAVPELPPRPLLLDQ